ncbi:hypothetical protein MBEHAL_0286 [Halarchaeum acidiphilum MH1-52-1]|uniref:Uncharacterized protein n=1 Tax=Halarchaeum acidiphilum MH1-52-1 TaxID=1261545 RepID=U2YD06_9EURY|nr:hypothetical protein MBEHAL_0286 [Halarchaeum acidiphilum MH1-52-1]
MCKEQMMRVSRVVLPVTAGLYGNPRCGYDLTVRHCGRLPVSDLLGVVKPVEGVETRSSVTLELEPPFHRDRRIERRRFLIQRREFRRVPPSHTR